MGKDTSDYKEVTYEGYGPHGIAVFVETLTDNTTRTVGDVVQSSTSSMVILVHRVLSAPF